MLKNVFMTLVKDGHKTLLKAGHEGFQQGSEAGLTRGKVGIGRSRVRGCGVENYSEETSGIRGDSG